MDRRGYGREHQGDTPAADRHSKTWEWSRLDGHSKMPSGHAVIGHPFTPAPRGGFGVASDRQVTGDLSAGKQHDREIGNRTTEYTEKSRRKAGETVPRGPRCSDRRIVSRSFSSMTFADFRHLLGEAVGLPDFRVFRVFRGSIPAAFNRTQVGGWRQSMGR